jgi:2-methylcitrate dehydratase PrpD
VSYSTALAAHMAGSRFPDIPATAVHAAKRLMIDTVGVAMAARSCPDMDAIARCCPPQASKSGATVWSTGQSTSEICAAFANSSYAAALEFDSLHSQTASHAGIVIVPAVLATVESAGRDGESVLLAVALGTDLMCRLAQCTRKNRGWFYTSLHGGIAAAAVTAQVLGADAARIADAMGLAFANAGGTQQPASERSPAKRIQGAFAALQGVICARLALEGLPGPREILEGPFGLFAMYEDGDCEGLLAGLGSRFEGENVSYKAFPICQCSHAAVEAMLMLRHQHALVASAVRRVSVHISPYMHRLVGAPFGPGAAPQVEAQFSVQYCVARALERGRLGIPEIEASAVLDGGLSDVLRRVDVRVDDRNTGKYAPIELVVETSDGRMLRHVAHDFPGSIDQPLDDARLFAKFHHCLDAAGIPRVAADKLLDCMLHMESHNAATLMRRIEACVR